MSKSARLAATVAALVMVGGAGIAMGQGDGPVADATIEAELLPVPSSEPEGYAGIASAVCPAGTRAVGGGVGSTGPALNGSVQTVFTVMLSGPFDETGATANTDDSDVARSWNAYVQNHSSSHQDFKVFALCSRSSDATVEAEPFNVPAGSAGSATATCPAGSRVVGGGIGTSGPTPVNGPAGEEIENTYVVQLSHPLDASGSTADTDDGDAARSWYALVLNHSGAAQDFKVFALCSQRSDATVQAELVDDVPPGEWRSGRAACPADTRALGGGVGTTFPDPPIPGDVTYRIGLTGPLDGTGSTANTEDGDAARSWYAYVENRLDRLPGGGPLVDFKVFALCSSERPGGGPGPGPGPGEEAPLCAGRRATIAGSAGPDILRGTRRADVIAGLGGRDRLLGRRGNDRICGGTGRDSIRGGPGRDLLKGGPGGDRLRGGPGRDLLRGGPGFDRQKQ